MSPAERYREVREATVALAASLSPEDCAIQSMPDASPTKWHLAHTTWFFETLVLEPRLSDFQPFDPHFRVLFNSYYNSVGDQYSRAERGLLSRPGLDEVLAYRRHVDRAVLTLLAEPEARRQGVGALIELGLHHEQQHQELILTDIKHAFSKNPMRPAYEEAKRLATASAAPLAWSRHDAGLRSIGYDGDGFAFDNERPAHRVFVEAFEIASRPATNAEYLAFMEAGGYRQPELWLSDGWAMVKGRSWEKPLYWQRENGGYSVLTLAGPAPLCEGEPVCHISYFEADAFARWSGARLPTEAEWEVAADGPLEGNFAESGQLHPVPSPAPRAGRPAALFGDLWEWTSSPYTPYPGFRPLTGALGEYNGKFMSSQMVLRGGSCATPRSHIRRSYRNFFYPDARWQFSGVRLARDAA